MQKYSEVIGLPVICAENGKKVGLVSDVIFSHNSRKVEALVLQKEGCQIHCKVIAINKVKNLGNDAVIINDFSCVTKDKSWLREKKDMHGKHIYSKEGLDLGVVKDILFDYKNASIEGFEVSDGIITDFFDGRKIIPLFGKVEFGEDTILVDNEAIEEISPTGGGINNFLK